MPEETRSRFVRTTVFGTVHRAFPELRTTLPFGDSPPADYAVVDPPRQMMSCITFAIS